MRKAISPWLIGTLIAVPVLMLVTPIASLWWIAGRALDRVEAEKDAVLAQGRLAKPMTPLFANPLPDDGIVYYGEAAKVLQNAGPLPTWPSDMAYRVPPLSFPSREALARISQMTAPAVGPLRRMLRCSRIQGGYHDDLPTAWLLVPCLLMSAEHARLEGRDADALRLLILLLGTNQANPESQALMYTAHAATEWGAVLDGHALTAAEAVEFRDLLERLERSRAPMIDLALHECAYRRVDALNFTQPDENGNLPGTNIEPGMRHLWSDRLLAYEALRITESDLREATRICSLPIHEQYPAALAAEAAIPVERVRIQRISGYWKLAINPQEFQEESWIRMMLLMCRIATAIAWFEIEQSREPSTLEELVPKYLPRLDPCPVTGRPVLYKEGVLISPDFEEGKSLTWRVRRR